MQRLTHRTLAAFAAGLMACTTAGTATASSHREAPFITTVPKVDGTDFYMFRSYETGRADFVTLIANYLPLQDSYGGPNYFTLDPSALYEIHIDQNGNGVEDLSFQFRFNTLTKGLALNVGPAGMTKSVAVPLINIGPVSATNTAAQNVVESFTVDVVRGDRRTGTRTRATNTATNTPVFNKPLDNIGNKSIADYNTYARSFIQNISIPGCPTAGKVFAGQRREGFVVNLGETFDLINIAIPAEDLAPESNARSAEQNTIDDKNITSIALELPISCLTNGTEPVIGAWTTASLRQARVLNPTPQQRSMAAAATNTGADLNGGAWNQVSRLGSPLVNEVVIGITDKDKFNASVPSNDVANFGKYVLTPTLPVPAFEKSYEVARMICTLAAGRAPT